MTPAVATEIRGWMAGIEAIIVRELASATVPGVIVDPPTGVTDSDPVETDKPQWRANGYSLHSDSIGLFRCKPVEDRMAKWPDWLRLECLNRFIDFNAYNGGVFPDDRARLNAYQNLISRKSVPDAGAGMGGDPFSLTACDFHFELQPEATERDYNLSPETQAKRNYVSKGIDSFTRYDEGGKPNGKAAGSHNWNPDIGAQFWVALNDAHARSLCEARGVDPKQFGL